MNPRTRKILAAVLAVAVLLAILWDLVPLPDAQARLAALPSAGLGFTSSDLPLNDVEKSIFGAARVLKRIYRLDRREFAVIVIDGARNRHAVHDPTYCFRGAGWSIAAKRDLTVPGGAAAVVTLQNGTATRTAAFWFSDGRTRHDNVAWCWWQMACRRLTFGVSGPAQVLVLVQPLDAGPVDWEVLAARLPFLFAF